MPNISGSPPRCAITAVAALASLVLLAALVERALAASTPVTVNNPAASPARTSSVDDAGRVAHQRIQKAPFSCANSPVCIFGWDAPLSFFAHLSRSQEWNDEVVAFSPGAEEADENPERSLTGHGATLFGRACFSQHHTCTAEVQIENFSTMTACYAGMQKWFSGAGDIIREKLDMTRNVEDNNVTLRCGPPESVKKVEKDASLGIHLRRTSIQTCLAQRAIVDYTIDGVLNYL
jgi:hypothetical protein